MRNPGPPSTGRAALPGRAFLVAVCLAFLLGGGSWPAAAQTRAGWVEFESEHFRVAVPSMHKGDAWLILDYAEKAWQRTFEYTGTEPPSGVTIYLYDRASYPQSPSYAWADSEKREIHMLAPSAQSPEDRRGWMDDLWYEATIYHEFVHVALEPLAGSTTQRRMVWLSEGLPEYLSTYRSTAAIRAKHRVFDSEVRALLREGRASFLHMEWGYASAGAFVRFLEESYGEGSALRLWQYPSESMSEALQAVLGVTAAQLEERWLRWLDETY